MIEVIGDVIATQARRRSARWRHRADLDLIRVGARALGALGAVLDGPVCLVRPGCGNGGLRWEDVRPVVEPLLRGDRFVVVERRP